MTGRSGALLAFAAASMLAGCGRVGLGEFGGASPPPPARYEPLPAAPTGQVTRGDLQPLPPVPGQEPGPGGEPGAAVADAGPVSSDRAPAIGRTDLLGGWKIASGADSCQLFMTLTTWSGGYRATTRGCTSPELQRISAWDLNGKQVALKGADGSTVATLYGTGAERFNGQTAERQPVSLAR